MDLIKILPTVAAAMAESTRYLKRMGEHCKPKYFYHTYRFFMNGWGTNTFLPEGLNFEVRVV